MIRLAKKSNTDYAICDFVCPTEDYRKAFDADCIVWLNTIDAGRFEDTNRIFEKPTNANYVITDWAQTDDMITNIIKAYAVKESRVRSIAKAVSWRTLGTIDTFILSWIITGRVDLAAAIGGIEIFTKIALFYLHERVWTKIKLR